MTRRLPKETELYQPVKTFLEQQGYIVKGEIGQADVVAVRGDDPPVIIELKTRFCLALFHQAIDRLGLSDVVYIAVPRQSGRAFQKALAANIKLARRLGIGVLSVRLSDGAVEAHSDPGPYEPRVRPAKRAGLLREFSRREGDPNLGGTRGQVMTVYRQDALKIADYLATNGASKGSFVAKGTGVARATAMMAADHYGWFERVEKGVYQLTPKGVKRPT